MMNRYVGFGRGSRHERQFVKLTNQTSAALSAVVFLAPNEVAKSYSL
jgi:hypothetical protein